MEKQTHKVAAIRYLRNSGYLKFLRRGGPTVREQIGNRFPKFVINVNVLDLTETCPELGNMLLNKPLAFQVLLKDALYFCLKTFKLVPECLAPSQVVLVVRPDSIPSFPQYEISSVSELISKMYSGLIKIEGIICYLTSPEKYTQIARYQCPNEECNGSRGDLFIRVSIPGAKEQETVGNDFCCCFCQSILIEDLTCRTIGDKMTIGVTAINAFQSLPFTYFRQDVVPVYCRDDLCLDLNIGQKCTIIGIPVHSEKDNLIFVALEACSIINLSCAINDKDCKLGENIHHIYETRSSSPWSFALSLSYLFGSEISPVGTFFHLKLIILLSLISSGSKMTKKISLLILTKHDLIIERLLALSSSFSHSMFRHSSIMPLVANVKKQSHETENYFVEAGSLSFSSEGICFIGNISLMTKSNQDILFQVLDTGHISEEIPHQFSTKHGYQVKIPKCTTIWAYSDANFKSEETFEGDRVSKLILDKLQIKLINSFDILVIMDSPEYTVTDYFANLQINFVLYKNSFRKQWENDFKISHNEWQNFIHYAQKINAIFTEEAEHLIRGYYIASRRIRCASGETKFPLTAISTLTSLSRSFAQISLRNKVTTDDALMAILLYEENTTVQYGPSYLNVDPVQHLNSDNISVYLGPENDKKMYEFHDHLLKFIAFYAGDTEFREE